jgi:feruloyl esterase
MSFQLLRASILSLAAVFIQLAEVDAATQYSQFRYGSVEQCQNLGETLKLEDTEVLDTTYYSQAQTVQLPGADPTCNWSAQISAPLCRVSLLVHTSSTSQVKMEVWLPDDWSGRVAAVGNGGLNGCKLSGTHLRFNR